MFLDVCVCLERSFSLEEQEPEYDENRSVVLRGMLFDVGRHWTVVPWGGAAGIDLQCSEQPLALITEGFPAHVAAPSSHLHSVPDLRRFPYLLPSSLSPSLSASLPSSL